MLRQEGGAGPSVVEQGEAAEVRQGSVDQGKDLISSKVINIHQSSIITTSLFLSFLNSVAQLTVFG